MADLPTELSQDAYDRLKSEHGHLTTEWRIEIARRIEDARALGDLSENADYHAAKDEQGKFETRIRFLEHMLKNATIVAGGGADGRVSTGTMVGLRYDGDDDIEHYLVGSIEEKREGIDVVSPASPLGLALIGRMIGDVVEYQAPNGRTLKVEVVEVGS